MAVISGGDVAYMGVVGGEPVVGLSAAVMCCLGVVGGSDVVVSDN